MVCLSLELVSLWVVLGFSLGREVFDELLVKVSWLGKLVLVFWWMELDFFSLECCEVSSSKL